MRALLKGFSCLVGSFSFLRFSVMWDKLNIEQSINGQKFMTYLDSNELEAEIKKIIPRLLSYFSDDCRVFVNTSYGPDMWVEIKTVKIKEEFVSGTFKTKVSSKGSVSAIPVMPMFMNSDDEDAPSLPSAVNSSLWRYIGYYTLFLKISNNGKDIPWSATHKELGAIMNRVKNKLPPTQKKEPVVSSKAKSKKASTSLQDKIGTYVSRNKVIDNIRSSLLTTSNRFIISLENVPDIFIADKSIQDVLVSHGFDELEWEESPALTKQLVTSMPQRTKKAVHQVFSDLNYENFNEDNYSDLKENFRNILSAQNQNYKGDLSIGVSFLTGKDGFALVSTSSNYDSEIVQLLWHEGIIYKRASKVPFKRMFDSKQVAYEQISEWLGVDLLATNTEFALWGLGSNRPLCDFHEVMLGKECQIEFFKNMIGENYWGLLSDEDTSYEEDDVKMFHYVFKPENEKDPLEFIVVAYGPMNRMSKTRSAVWYTSTEPGKFFHTKDLDLDKPDLFLTAF